MRIGFGYDSHRLVEGRGLILGGIAIPHEKGLLGHSDADVLVHAICDAILGATDNGDIGMNFPDTDPAYKNISSLELLRKVDNMAKEKGFLIGNIDSTVVLERPKIADYISSITMKISSTLSIPQNKVSVKAKTNEKMGFIGREEGIVAFAVVLMIKQGGI